MFSRFCFFRAKFSTQTFPQHITAVQKKKTIDTIRKLHKENIPITMMTAHDYPSGFLASQSDMDIILVGDSLAMVALGYPSTMEITLEEMMHHSRAVCRGAKVPFLVGDMPFGTYESTTTTAVQNAIRFLKEGKVEAVKLEGGEEMALTIEKITRIGIPVLGHIGLTPQRVSSLGGFKAQGKSLKSAQKLIVDAQALEQAGCFAIVLEAIPEKVATFITNNIGIPTIGIGAGPGCSGQVLVQLDALGVYDQLAPKFSKVFGNIGERTIDALKEYGRQVRTKEFPESGTHTYKMLKGQEELFVKWTSEVQK